MSQKPSLKNARILISNDDGIFAPGIQVLEEVACTLSDDVWVVAPETQQSAKSHALTTRNPVRLRKLEDKRFAVDGTPTDSVLVALKNVMLDSPPDLLLSGINFGANLADDVTYSGTVAAAMEATLLGVPSIAFSQCFDDRDQIPWETARQQSRPLIEKLWDVGWASDVLMNVNFPPIEPEAVTGVAAAPTARGEGIQHVDESQDPYGRPYFWLGHGPRHKGEVAAGSDVDVIGQGKVSVTPIMLDLTHHKSLDDLAQALS